jgi:hypothetical protein
MSSDPYSLLTKEKIELAFAFYRQAGLVQQANPASFDAAAHNALRGKFCLLDINYLLQEVEASVFTYSQDYALAFMQQDTPYAHVFEQLVADLAGFTANRFCPEPLSIVFDNERNGKLSFRQNGVLFERELFTQDHYLTNLLTLLNEAIRANGGDAVELYLLYFPDAAQEAFVLLTKAHRQMAEEQELLIFLR